jgi:hypothetical protein
MSFIGKAVKKIFKVAKKIVKSKWFKIALIAAACVFTAGIAAGGFAAFSGVSTIGGFFGAVGTTMSTGMSAIAGALGMTAAAPAGVSSAAAIAAEGGVIAGTGIGTAGIGMATGATALEAGAIGGSMASALGATTAATGAAAGAGGGAILGLAGGMPGAIAATAGATSATTAAGGWLGKMGGLLMDKGVAGTAMRQGIMGGISMAMQASADKKEDKYRRSRYVWGGPAFGGDGTGMEMPELKDSTAGGVFDTSQQMAQAPRQVKNRQVEGTEGPKLASLLTPNEQMAQQNRPLTPEQSASVGQQPAGQFVPQNLGVA